MGRYRLTAVPMLAAVMLSAWLPTISVAQSMMVDSAAVVEDLRFLSDTRLAGRAAGTPGNREAAEYIASAFATAGLQPFHGSFFQQFELPRSSPNGLNVVGWKEGTEYPEEAIVVTAHFDHLGTRGGAIYPGADDNASGSAALVELARIFANNAPKHTVIFAALDAEEIGLVGANQLVARFPLDIAQVLLNVNLDMVSRSEARELFAVGTYHYPTLESLTDSLQEESQIVVLTGHDRPDGSAGEDWTYQSDHAAFHRAGIPFLYFGVEDHPDYHRSTDTFERIDLGFYVEVVRVINQFIRLADDSHDLLARLRH